MNQVSGIRKPVDGPTPGRKLPENIWVQSKSEKLVGITAET